MKSMVPEKTNKLKLIEAMEAKELARRFLDKNYTTPVNMQSLIQSLAAKLDEKGSLTKQEFITALQDTEYERKGQPKLPGYEPTQPSSAVSSTSLRKYTI